jgi:hypothetical protein
MVLLKLFRPDKRHGEHIPKSIQMWSNQLLAIAPVVLSIA